MMRRFRLAVGTAVLALLAGAVRAEESTTAFAPAVTEADLARHLGWIADPAREGRETTEDGARQAADYIAREMERVGLQPLGDDGTWLQHYTVPIPILGEGNVFEARVGDETHSFQVEKDWNPFSVSGKVEAEGEVVFAGYGITAPGRGYDDYEGIEVSGKIVLLLRKDPGWRDQRHAAFLRKLKNAADHGAIGVLLCNDPATTGDGADRIGHWSAMLGAPAGSSTIPYVFLTQDAARTLLACTGQSLEELEETLRSNGPASQALEGVEVTLETDLSTSDAENATNVVGFLRGRDESVASEVVVVGAHYDHVGHGRFGSLGGPSAAGSVHPGADDNGSGTAALLELAGYFGDPAHRPRRSLLFLAFSGEEMGLLGSAHYVEHPVVPLEDVVAMVNMDMVGRCRNGKLDVGGIGTGEGLKEIVAGANETHGLQITWDPQGEAPSDSTSFFRKKIPVLFLFTGLHEDYHRPSDTVDKICFPDLERVALLARDVVGDLADRPERVTYTDPPPVPRPPLIGVGPSPEPDPRGVLLAQVVGGGPADEAGLEAGDVIVSLAGQVVRNRRDLMTVLRKLKAGKGVAVEVLRGDERVSLEIVPAERRGR